MTGKARIGETVTGSVVSSVLIRVMHMSRGLPFDLGRARAALAGLAVPAHGEVRSELCLDAVDDVEDDLALDRRHRVVAELRRPRRRPARWRA